MQTLRVNDRQGLQDAVVEVPGELNSIFANGDLPETIGQVQLVERVADLPRDHFDDRLQVIGRWIDAGEKHTSHEMFSAKRHRRARSIPESIRQIGVEFIARFVALRGMSGHNGPVRGRG